MCVDITALDRCVLVGLQEPGILLLLGTDAGGGGTDVVPGYSTHDERRILVANGFASYAALQTGMVNAAIVVERTRGGGDFGTIEEGKRADLISVQDNPLDDITSMKAPLGVIAAGRWYAKETLAKLIEPARKSARYIE